MRTRTEYKDTVILTCLENNKTVKGEVLDFKPAYMITVSIDRKVRVVMRYNTDKKLYLGKVGSLEFSSTGPSKTEITQGRRG
jgi:hypothetical protein